MHGEPGDSARHEALFRAAEIRALTGKQLRLLPSLGSNASDLPEDSRFLNAAILELERRAVRLRNLPVDLISENGWMIMLDLFVSEQEVRRMKVIDLPARWNLSPSTAARQIAALIETSLVTRVFDETNHSPVTLRLTDIGKHYVKRVLFLLD